MVRKHQLQQRGAGHMKDGCDIDEGLGWALLSFMGKMAADDSLCAKEAGWAVPRVARFIRTGSP